MRIPLSVIKHLLMITKLSHNFFSFRSRSVYGVRPPVDVHDVIPLKTKYRTNNISHTTVWPEWRKRKLVEVTTVVVVVAVKMLTTDDGAGDSIQYLALF